MSAKTGFISKAGLAALCLAFAVAVTSEAEAGKRRKGAVRAAPKWSQSIFAMTNQGLTITDIKADEKRFPASTTKLMTLLLTFEALKQGTLKLGDALEVSSYAASREPTKLGLTPKIRPTVEEAIYGLAVHSANDAAVVLAERLGVTEKGFAQMMTAKAHAIGMSGSTVFRNASGLPATDQRTTARDLATLALYIHSNFSDYLHYFSAMSFTFSGRRYRSHNKFAREQVALQHDDKPVPLVTKTGYIRASGFNLVATCPPDDLGRFVIGVVMGQRSARAAASEMEKICQRGAVFMADNPTSLPPPAFPGSKLANN